MNDVEIGRLVRQVRLDLRMTQAEVAQRAGLDRSTVSLVERGQLARLSVRCVRGVLEALEITMMMRLSWRGPAIDRLRDERHAAMGSAWKDQLERWRWLVRPEVSFNRYGERGRIDLLAWHASRRILAVGEVKSDFVDTQDLLGALDAKVRLAPVIARSIGWERPALVVPVLILPDQATVKRRFERVSPLFGQFTLQGRAATAWLRDPTVEPDPGGLVVFSNRAYAAHEVGSPGPLARVRASRRPQRP